MEIFKDEISQICTYVLALIALIAIFASAFFADHAGIKQSYFLLCLTPALAWFAFKKSYLQLFVCSLTVILLANLINGAW